MKLLAKFIKAFSLIFFPLPSRWYTSKNIKFPRNESRPPPTRAYPERWREVDCFSIISNPPPSAPNLLRIFSSFFETLRIYLSSCKERSSIERSDFLTPGNFLRKYTFTTSKESLRRKTCLLVKPLWSGV